MNFYTKCVFVISIFGVLEFGSCYQCYSCAGSANETMPEVDGLPPGLHTITKGCASPIKSSDLAKAKVDCTDVSKTCIKAIIKAKDNTDVFVRDCLTPDFCTLFTQCHSCKSDLCNSSSAIGPSLLIVSIISFFVANFCF